MPCGHWGGGFCRVLCRERGELIECPQARADAVEPGECCHDPASLKRLPAPVDVPPRQALTEIGKAVGVPRHMLESDASRDNFSAAMTDF